MCKQNVVVLYTRTCVCAYKIEEQGTSVSLHPWPGNSAYYGGHDDGGKVYLLPHGCYLGETNSGENAIFSAAGEYCRMIRENGRIKLLVGNIWCALSEA